MLFLLRNEKKKTIGYLIKLLAGEIPKSDKPSNH